MILFFTVLMVINASIGIYYYFKKDYAQACWFLLIVILIDRGMSK